MSLHLEVHDVVEGAGGGSLGEWGSPIDHLIGDHSHGPPVTLQAIGASPVLIHHGQHFGSHVVWGPNGEFGIHLDTRKWNEHITLSITHQKVPTPASDTNRFANDYYPPMPLNLLSSGTLSRNASALLTFKGGGRDITTQRQTDKVCWWRILFQYTTEWRWISWYKLLIQQNFLANTKGLNPGPYKR